MATRQQCSMFPGKAQVVAMSFSQDTHAWESDKDPGNVHIEELGPPTMSIHGHGLERDDVRGLIEELERIIGEKDNG